MKTMSIKPNPPGPCDTAIKLLEGRPKTLTVLAHLLPDTLDAVEQQGGSVKAISVPDDARRQLVIVWWHGNRKPK